MRYLIDEVHHARSAAALTLAHRIRGELARADDLTPVAVDALVLEMLVVLGREMVGRPESDSPPAWLARVRDLLHDRYVDDVSLDEAAREAGVHPSHLSREFSRWFGSSFGAYKRTVRVEAARRALAGSDRPLAAVAIRTGFADQSHLTRAVKAATGMTPAAYRRAFGATPPPRS